MATGTASAERGHSARRIAVRDEGEAVRLAHLQGWTDGLPVVGPTPTRVDEMLDGRPPGTVVAHLVEQDVRLTLELVAINAVLAGCVPADFAVVVAVVAAMGRPEFSLHSTSVSGATAPLAIVGGPATTAFDVTTGFNLFGPGAGANTRIGRAVRLVLLNGCGAIPGVVDKSTFGHPGKLAFCVGEAHEHLPTGWEPLHHTRGVDEASGVTVVACDAPIQVRNDWSNDAEELLRAIADVMTGHHAGGCWVVVLGPRHAAAIAAAGWDRRDVTSFLRQASVRPATDVVHRGRIHPAAVPGNVDQLFAVDRAEDILVTVAGGHLYGYSAVLPPWVGGRESRPVSVPLPPRPRST